MTTTGVIRGKGKGRLSLYVGAYGKKRGRCGKGTCRNYFPESGHRKVGNRRRVFKRQCQGKAGNRKDICREPSGVCNQCHSPEGVQPKELDASEIEVRIGATWIEPKYIEDFMRETFETPDYLFDRNLVGVQYSDVTGQWNVKGKNADRGNSLVNMTYGTSRANAYRILEDSLNLRDTSIFDTIKPVASFLMSERIAEHDKDRMLAEGSRGRVSVKEKLAEMKKKACGHNMTDKREFSKSKVKQETL